MSVIRDGDAAPVWQMVFAALLVIALPQSVALVAFSSMGVAPQVAEHMANGTADLAGNGLAGMCAILLAFAFVIDAHRRPICIRLTVALLSTCCFLAAATLKYISYPWLGGFVCFGVAVASVAYIRVHHFKPATVPGQDFFGAVAMSFVVAAFLLISTWIGWQGVTDNTWSSSTKGRLAIDNGAVYSYIYGNESWEFQNYCSINGTSVSLPANLTDDETAAIESACQKSETVWFLQWAAPCVLGICNSIVAGVCWVFAKAASALELEREGDAQHFQKVLKLCASLIVLMLGLMYSAQYVSGADVTVSSALLALGARSMTAILLFMLLEFGFERLHQSTQQDGLTKNLISIAKSDWMKALVIGGLNVFVPTLAILDRLRQKIRRCTGLAPSDDTSPFTKEGRQVIGEMTKWTWCSIFLKIAMLGEIFVSLIVGMKVTYVFFSWLNETLAAAELPFAVLAVLVLGVALVMFLCPIVPGSAVYLFSGVIFGAQSQLPGSIGFPLGVISASALSSLAKLIACCLQYGLGYMMGKSVKVQQFVGVDKVSIRAMEQILKQNGLKPDKVGILVAGPDWPTSVLCGILRLNIPQMLLGTAPVILVSIAPQVLVGALQTLADGKSGIMGMVSSSVTMAAAVVQALAMFFVSYRIMKVIEEDGPTLAMPRPEHEAVAELTRKEAVYTEALRQASEWPNMKCGQKFLAFTSAACLLLAGFLLSTDFILSEKFCFRSFSITSSIGAAIEVGGLNGNVANLVMFAGWLALGIAFAGFLLHVLLSKWLAHAARFHLRRDSPDQPKGSTIGRPLKRDTE
ncbi:CIT [Symbiodinium necroappetens]|uniref:CIT protein n=1 Tax=Symbiodinium necroappetens TaxID=1628268 RepID=A0A812VWM6_9DINO|nr:CIT [Symbiodinium necroappetens]|mmetsp:Transcript_62664/g.149528  ORF Transcript_62664/g.149528 Transcript_62664/m.149528 type:complete len:804 (+) Transcript_62664:36-2447(+)